MLQRMFFHRNRLTGWVLASVACLETLCCAIVWAGDSGLTMLTLVRDLLLIKALYSVPHRLASDIASDGSVSVNTDWEHGQLDTWYIEQQRYGGDLIQAGVSTNDDSLINEGLRFSIGVSPSSS
jgi:hypothetical protein